MVYLHLPIAERVRRIADAGFGGSCGLPLRLPGHRPGYRSIQVVASADRRWCTGRMPNGRGSDESVNCPSLH
jgi:hypothetical protein